MPGISVRNSFPLAHESKVVYMYSNYKQKPLTTKMPTAQRIEVYTFITISYRELFRLSRKSFKWAKIV